MKRIVHVLASVICAGFIVAPTFSHPLIAQELPQEPLDNRSPEQPPEPQESESQVDGRPNIAVLTLAHGDISHDYWWWRRYYRGWGAARGISELLVTELVADGAYVVTDSSQIDHYDNGYVNESGALEQARELGLDAVISGTITQFDLKDNRQCIRVPFLGRTCKNETQATVQLNVRLIDPDTGTIVATAKGEGEATATGGYIDLSRGPDGSTDSNREVDELLTEATEEAISEIVPEIVAANNRF